MQEKQTTFQIKARYRRTVNSKSHSNQIIDRTKLTEQQSSIDLKGEGKITHLVDLIPPVEVGLEPIPHDVVAQRRVEQHPRADAHCRALRVDGHPHHHPTLPRYRAAIPATQLWKLLRTSSTGIARKLLDSHRSPIN